MKKFMSNFNKESELVKGLLTLMSSLLEQNHKLSAVLATYPNFNQMFINGMIKSENYILRKEFSGRTSILTMQMAMLDMENRSAERN